MSRTHLAALVALSIVASAGTASAQTAGTYDANGDGVLDVQIIYDETGPYSELGLIYAEMLMNLLGHFPEVEAWSVGTQEYQAGDLLSNEVTFYIGSTYGESLPTAFQDDFWTTDRPVIWMGYNLWTIAWNNWNDFILEYGFQHWYIAGNDGAGETTDFYRYVQYNGQELPKFAWWNTDSSTFVNDPFVNILYIDDPTKLDVKAEIVHSGSGDTQPYIVSSGNLTVVNDIPFTYIHEQDRYLAFADALHDFIGIDHAPTQQALFRLEDVHPSVAPSDIRQVTNVLKENIQRPWSIAVVPSYADPLGYYNNGTPEFFDMNDSQALSWRLQMARAQRWGAELVLHGFTHQYVDVPNPYNGVSGDDFEFWDAVAEAPIAEDTYAWFESRVDSANQLLAQRNWQAFAWEVPHYRASVSDYLWINDFYATSYHRVVYQAYEVELWGNVYTHNEIFEDDQSVADWENATVSVAGDIWGGQFFPYVVEKDVYGNKIIPENMGNLEPIDFALGPQYVRTVPDLLANAEANLVNRCAFASMFYHPYLMQFPGIPDAGGADSLRALIQGVEALGYTFVSPSSL